MDERDLIRETFEASSYDRPVLAAAMGVSVPSLGRLLRKERELLAAERDRAFQKLGIGLRGGGLREVPRLGEIGAGGWIAQDRASNGTVWASEGGPNAFALTIVGDSMNKLAHDGADVIVDPDDRNLVDKKYYAVVNDIGDGTFKRFRTDPARLEPVSLNPDHVPTIIGTDDFRITGRVCQVVYMP